jgi:hypothetical protein
MKDQNFKTVACSPEEACWEYFHPRSLLETALTAHDNNIMHENI